MFTSSVFRLDIGKNPTVWLCDYDIIQEASKTGAIDGRPYHTIPTIKETLLTDSNGKEF